MALKRLSEAIHRGVGTPLRVVLDRLMCNLGLGPCPDDKNATNKVAFTVGVVALAAKMAKADGIVSQIETDAFREIFAAADSDAKGVQRIFDLAKQDVAGFESYAQQVAGLLSDEPQLKRDVFEGLFNIAAADGILHQAEEVYLKTIAEIFGFSDPEYRGVRAQFVYDENDVYTVLGLEPSVSNGDLKARYRQLVRDNHPDVLLSRGVPTEFIDLANRKLASINAAYEQIARERGL